MVSLKSLLALAIVATHALAIPLESTIVRRDEDSGLIILDEYVVEDGTITIYGDDPASTPEPEEESNLERRCGSNTILCATTYRAASYVCSGLINNLRNTGALPVSPRSVCLSMPVPLPGIGTYRCCVSWANNVSNLRGTYLVNGATKTLNSCTDPQAGVSGKSRDTNLNGVCTTQCLSNRPDGCSY